MNNSIKIAVILTAVDKMSAIINSSANKSLQSIEKLRKASQTKLLEGGALVATGAGIIGSLNQTIKAYEAAEESKIRLKTSMMDNMGRTPKGFEKITRLITELGNQLPGTTKDFNALFQAMRENGIQEESLYGGAGRAAAYLGVDLKMPLEVAGQYAARLQQAAGVANQDLEKFFDTISRLKTAGINSDELQYAFSRASGTLKNLGLQGLQAAKDMGVFFSTLVRNGQSGETAATSFNSMIESILNPKRFAKAQAAASQYGIKFDFFKSGQFLGIENTVAQFDKLKSLDPTQIAKVVNALTGGGQDAQALNIIIKNGLDGYKKMQAEIASKASLQQKINEQLGTLSAIKEATAGTIENLMAAFGQGLAPVLKGANKLLGDVADRLNKFLEANPEVAKMLSMVTLLTGSFFILGGVVKIIQGIRFAMIALNLTMAANPFIAVAMGIIVGVSLIYTYWEPISRFFKDLWDKISDYAKKAWDVIEPIIRFTPLGIVVNNWDGITSFFKGLFGTVEGDTKSTWDKIKETIGYDPMPDIRKNWEAVKNFFDALWDSVESAFALGSTASKMAIEKLLPSSKFFAAWNEMSTFFDGLFGKNKISFQGFLQFGFDKAKEFFQLGADIAKHIIDGFTSRIKILSQIWKGAAKLMGWKEPPQYKNMAELQRANAPAGEIIRQFSFLPANMPLNQFVPPVNAAMPVSAIPKTSKPAGAITNRSTANSNNYNNHITISLNGTATPKDAENIVTLLDKHLPGAIKKYNTNKARVSF